MPSGPVAAALALAVLAVIGGIYLFWELRHHAGHHGRDRQRGGERLPLFGTDLLVAGGTGRELPPVGRPFSEPLEEEDGAHAGARPLRLDDARPAPLYRGPAEVVDADEQHAIGNGAPRRGPMRAFTPPASRPGVRREGTAPFAPGHPSRDHAGRDAAGDAQLAAFAAAPRAADRPGAWGGKPAFHEGETVRFSIPDEGTLQFLPGRLEVVAGPDAGREVRFVRTPGETQPEITFGRSEGPDYRHVQLVARTVSRRHALMTLLDGHWQLKNLSATNPVVLNGRSLADGEVAPLLVTGDRIEMGEVLFVFHER